MDWDEKAREIVAARWCHPDSELAVAGAVEAIAQALREADQAGYLRGVEAAAKVADSEINNTSFLLNGHPLKSVAARNIARDIRALVPEREGERDG